MKISQISRFHNIGQGLFYSSDFYSAAINQKFRYIIDCGTHGSIEFDFWYRPVTGSIIQKFKNEVKKLGDLENLLILLKKGVMKNHKLVEAYEMLASDAGMDDLNDTSLCVSITAINLKHENSYIISDIEKYSLFPSKLVSAKVFNRAIWLSESSGIRKLVDITPLQYIGLELKFGYLFTGDLMLNNNVLYNIFFKHYSIKKEKIHILYVPHHGAQSS